MESRLGLVTDESARTMVPSSATQPLSSEVAAAVGSGIIGQPPQPRAGLIGGLNPPTLPSGPVSILTPPIPVGGGRPIGPIGSPGGPIGLPPLPPRGNMWGGPVGIAMPPTPVGGGMPAGPILVSERIGRRAGGGLYGPPPVLTPYMPPTPVGGGMPAGPILVSERIGRRAGGGLYGPPPVLTPYRPPVVQGPPEVAGGGLQPPGATQATTAVAAVATRANAAAAQNAANIALTQTTAGRPMQLTRATANAAGAPATAGNVVAIAGPVGRAQVTSLGAPSAVVRTATQGQVATVGGVMTAENVQNPLLTRYLNEVYAPVVMQTVGRPTTIVARRTVGNVGTRTVGNVQGGVTISGPQGSVYIPAQQLLAAATG